jgi:hypothetical protein
MIEVVLIRRRWCSILWLPIGILCGAKCECKYTFDSLLLVLKEFVNIVVPIGFPTPNLSIYSRL